MIVLTICCWLSASMIHIRLRGVVFFLFINSPIHPWSYCLISLTAYITHWRHVICECRSFVFLNVADGDYFPTSFRYFYCMFLSSVLSHAGSDKGNLLICFMVSQRYRQQVLRPELFPSPLSALFLCVSFVADDNNKKPTSSSRVSGGWGLAIGSVSGAHFGLSRCCCCCCLTGFGLRC